MQTAKLKNILEAVLLGADRTLTVNQMESLFELDEERPTRDEIRKVLHDMAEDYEPHGFELKQVASGFRLQVKQEYATWVGRLWEEKPTRYTRALLETMALIAYRQPITRGEIEEVRGVSVSSNIIKTLLERDWIKVLGHKDVPGKPSLYGTTKQFLDYFNLKSLDQLPTLAEIKDLDNINPELELDDDQEGGQTSDQDSKQEGDPENNPESGEEGSQNLNQENDHSEEKQSIGEMDDARVDDESVAEELVSDDATDETTIPEASEEPAAADASAEDSLTADDLDDDIQNEEMDAIVEREKQVFNV